MIDKLVLDFLNKVKIELKKKDNVEKIKNEILNPLIKEFTDKVYPYVSLLFIMYCVNLILIIIILILIIIFNSKKNNFSN